MNHHASANTPQEIAAAVATIPHWFHSIDLGHGIITPGDKSPQLLAQQLHDLHLPDLQKKSVLDIGAASSAATSEARRRRRAARLWSVPAAAHAPTKAAALPHYLARLEVARP